MATPALQKRLSCLMVSPHPSVPGGVSGFIESMKRNFRATDYESCWVGKRPDLRENALQTLLRLLCTPFAVYRRVKKGNFDIVHINPSLTPNAALRDGLILLAVLLAGRARTIVQFHGWEARVEGAIHGLPPLRYAFVALLRRTNRIFVLAPAFKRALEEFGVPADIVELSTTMFDGQALGPRPEASTRHVAQSILFLGRFEREKGVHELLDAFSRLAPSFPQSRLIFCGDGAERDSLVKRTAGLGLAAKVVFCGYLQGAEKAAQLWQCAIFVLPSYSEGMPIGILEAMAAGKPVIATRVGGIPSIVHDPQNGLLVEAGNSVELEGAMTRLLSDAVLSGEMGRSNALTAWEAYEAGIVTARMERTYRDVAALAGGGA